MDEVKDWSGDEITTLIESVKDSVLITSDKVKEIISIAGDAFAGFVKVIGIFKN